MEVWDLYDRHRQIIGEHIRGTALPENGFHLVVHVWIRNDQGEYLIAQRAATRPTFPLKWECVGGSVLKGETSLQGALREVREEVGIPLEAKTGRIVFTKVRETIDGKPFNDIVDVWLFPYDGAVDLSAATTDEVAQVRWMSAEEIEKLFASGEMVHTIKTCSTLWRSKAHLETRRVERAGGGGGAKPQTLRSERSPAWDPCRSSGQIDKQEE